MIDDCYNANPMSMRAALEDLAVSAARDRHPRRIAVLGDMLELGPDERRFHAEIGAAAEDADVDVLVTVGPLAAAMTDRFDGEAYPVADAEEAAALLPELLAPRRRGARQGVARRRAGSGVPCAGGWCRVSAGGLHFTPPRRPPVRFRDAS